MFPVASVGSPTATGDVITGPGGVTTTTKGLPVACMGDAVTGAVCTGVVSVSTAPNKIVGGRPVAAMTSTVTGVNPATGVPVTTVCMSTNVADIV